MKQTQKRHHKSPVVELLYVLLGGECEEHHHHKGRIQFTAVTIGSNVVKGDIMALVLTDSQQCGLGPIAPLDSVGNPAPVDGAPTWAVSDPSILSITPSADGLSATIFAVGPLGTGQVSVSADADMGSGITTITGTLDVQIVAGQAVSLTIPTGTPSDKGTA